MWHRNKFINAVLNTLGTTYIRFVGLILSILEPKKQPAECKISEEGLPQIFFTQKAEPELQNIDWNVAKELEQALPSSKFTTTSADSVVAAEIPEISKRGIKSISFRAVKSQSPTPQAR